MFKRFLLGDIEAMVSNDIAVPPNRQAVNARFGRTDPETSARSRITGLVVVERTDQPDRWRRFAKRRSR